jgi:hypothetical protein
MAGKKLARNVNINGTTYLAGESVPKDIADQITNEKAWQADEDAPERLVEEDSTEPAPNASREDIEAAKVNADGPASPAEAAAARKAAAAKSPGMKS